MCRWLAYSGPPLRLSDFLMRPDHSLIDQSRHARQNLETTNGDGFGGRAWKIVCNTTLSIQGSRERTSQTTDNHTVIWVLKH